MKKITLMGISGISLLIIAVMAGCGASSTEAFDSEFYTESISSISNADWVEAQKIVDDETGCKYLVIRGYGEESVAVVQMRYIDENGAEKLLCKDNKGE